jgi:RND family efflux transporter MFP subunit
MKKMLIATTSILSVFLITSCGNNDQTVTKNIDEMYKEQGIPVEVRSLTKDDFITYQTFTSTLKGSKESNRTSMVSDTVEEILVEVGDYVKKDQPVIRFPKNNPSANYYQAEAAFKAAEQGFRRIETLYNNNGVSRQTYDDTRTQYDVQLANWKTVNDMIEVKAPLSGYITRLNVQSSDNVHPGDTLFTVSNFDTLSSIVWVADHEIRSIKKGQKAKAVWEDITITGVVYQVDLAMDPQKKAFAVHIRFDNPDQKIPSGIMANIDIETSLTKNAIVLHRNEILRNQNEWYVYVAENGHALKQVITPGRNQGMYYEILSGLEEETKLITEGLSLVRNESLIVIPEESTALLSQK